MHCWEKCLKCVLGLLEVKKQYPEVYIGAVWYLKEKASISNELMSIIGEMLYRKLALVKWACVICYWYNHEHLKPQKYDPICSDILEKYECMIPTSIRV